MDQYVKANKSDIEEQFKSRVIEDDSLAIQDLFPFFEASFHLEEKEGLMILEDKNQKDDFFQSINSYKRLFAIATDYMIDRRGFSN